MTTGINTPAAWTAQQLKNPHVVADKATLVRRMFSSIAPTYDLNNRLHSMGMDQLWRRAAVKMAAVKPTDTIVDVACGTGDLALQFAGALKGGIAELPGRVIGVDFTFAMLPLAASKANRAGCAIAWMNGDAMALPLADESCDVLAIAFGIRNVADAGLAIGEFYRVLRPGGRLVILEFSLPENGVIRGLYNFYFRKIMPRTCTFISGDKTGAYRYLPESVNTFISRDTMLRHMNDAGFGELVAQPLTMGVCVCYRGIKEPPKHLEAARAQPG